MGLIDFVKDAGERLFGNKTGAASAPSAPAPSAPRPQNLDQLKQDVLEKRFRELGLDIDNLSISVHGDQVTLRGKAADQATKEKAVLVAGNVSGVGKVDDELEVEKQEPQASLYAVKPGDSLSKIAKTFYGDAGKYPVIFEANKPMLKDPDKIYPGQVLRIPHPDTL